MSDSRKDGRRGGGHVNTQNREVWSRRCPKVNMWPAHGRSRATRGFKWYTHRYERRVADRTVRELLSEPDA